MSNDGDSNLAYDAFRAKMKEWGRYEKVGSPHTKLFSESSDGSNSPETRRRPPGSKMGFGRISNQPLVPGAQDL
jgi:hypothetical protein